VVPPTLRITGAGGIQTEAMVAAYPGQRQFQFTEHWNRPDVRGALYAQHGRVCAYCGSGLTRGDRGDVDHFRPKASVAGDEAHGGYWWLAYDFQNYLLSCRKCNSTYKRNRFPLAPGGERIAYENRERIAEEARLLLDPCVEALEDLLELDLSTPLNPLLPIESKSGLPEPISTRVKESLDFFEINFQPDLIKARMDLFNKITKAVEAGDPKRVRLFAVRYRPNSFIARYILQRRAPELLPTVEEELSWLMKDMLRTLRLVLQIQQFHQAARLQREHDEILWSFAFLLADPPVQANIGVRDFLSRHQIESYALQKYAYL
jgi:hypothetical protein